MPATNHLQWFEIKDFGGLWTAGASSMMPANKAQVMSGCHPQVGGGLRAFLKVVDTVNAAGAGGSPSPLNTRPLDEVVAGFGVTPAGFLSGPATEQATVFWVVTVNGDRYLSLTGAGTAYASAPDEAGFDITGDIDIRVKVAMDDWTPAAVAAFVSNLNATSFLGYEFRLTTAGNLVLAWGNGASVLTMTSTAAAGVTDGTAKWVRVTLDVNDGGGNRVANFYTSDDGITWSALGSTVTTAGTTSISASGNQLRVGGRPDASFPLAGKIYAVDVKNGIAGTSVANPDFTAQTPGATTVTDGLDNVWTLNGAAAIVSANDPLLQDWNLWHWEQSPLDIDAWFRNTAVAFGGANTAFKTPPNAQPQFARFGVSSTKKDYIAVALRENGDVSGLFYIDPKTAAVGTRNTTAFDDNFGATGVVEHQGRLVVGYKDQIKFSAPSSDSFSAAGSGFVQVNPQGWLSTDFTQVYEGSLIAWMVSAPPGDLVVATRDGRVYNVQGDLADPTVLELGRWTTMLPHAPANTPNGIYIILPNLGVASLGLDGSLTVVSQDILPAVWNPVFPKNGLGQLAGTERYLFCPNQHTTTEHKNGALVYDFNTGAWFTSTHTDDYSIPNPKYMLPDDNPFDSGIWVVSGVPPAVQGLSQPFIFQYRTGGYNDASASTEARASTWEFKSAPVREPSGRYLDIHRVEIPTHAFNNNTSTLAVTIDGTTITKTLPSGRSIQTYLFKKRGDDLDVTVKAKSNDTAIEAPMIESIRVGWSPGPLL